MKINFLSFLVVFSIFFVGCSESKVIKEINIEKKKVNDSLVRATVNITYQEGKTQTQEVKVIEGRSEEVNAQIAQLKEETFLTQGETPHGENHKKEGKTEEVKALQFSLTAKSSSTVSGMVHFTEENGTVALEAHINGLTPGTHAIHIHEKADCSSADGKSTGGHWNPTFEPHGAWGAESGFHRGDIGNFTADETGHGMVMFKTDLWCLGCEDQTKNILGKAIIVHQGEDDLTSQPSGAAGARISCVGIIE